MIYTQPPLKKYQRYFFLISSVLLIIFVIVYLSIALYVAIQAERDTKSKADAILILGARSYIEGKYNPCLVARIKHAVDLYKTDYAPKILVSGGVDSEDKMNEVETMKKIAVESGVSPKDILLENRASSTYENFVFSQIILKKNGLKSVIIVTEPFHAARAALVAEKLRISFTVSPAADSPCWTRGKFISWYFLKEPLAVLLYKVEGRL
jgi:uncharacterized SAM-binding protein YcdF (DUF218 family)